VREDVFICLYDVICILVTHFIRCDVHDRKEENNLLKKRNSYRTE
jgi:hypothetical protein